MKNSGKNYHFKHSLMMSLISYVVIHKIKKKKK